MKPTKGSGGSAVRRLRTTLKDAGVLGSWSKKDKVAGGAAGKKKVRTSGGAGGGDVLKLESPFEVKVTRRKHEIVGRKAKGVEGRPGLAKAKAIQKRNETLLPEYLGRGRVSEFVDRRFGETDPTLSLEEKMVERFAKERLKSGGKKSMFTLADDMIGDDSGEGAEELTHLGQSLSAIDDFDRTEIDLGVGEDDGEEDLDGSGKGGQMNRSMTALNFGGFKGDGKTPEAADDGRPKSKREIMMEVISKSKFHKVKKRCSRGKCSWYYFSVERATKGQDGGRRHHRQAGRGPEGGS